MTETRKCAQGYASGARKNFVPCLESTMVPGFEILEGCKRVFEKYYMGELDLKKKT